MEENKEQLKANLIALIKLFDNSPHVLVNYLIEHEALTRSFGEKIINNKKLTELAKLDEPKAPFFKSSNEMMTYYNELFTYNQQAHVDPKPIPYKNDVESLQSQLEKALADEDYLKAAQIRDYAKEVNIKLQA